LRRRILGWPSTRLGWWSIALAATSVALTLIYLIVVSREWLSEQQVIGLAFTILPSCALAALAAGIVGLIAVIRRHERSLLVWLTMLPMLMIVFNLLSAFLRYLLEAL
jgi:hypothetical protein